jgi:hypothetical protein
VLRRVEIRFTGAKANHILPFGFELLRLRIDGQRQ